MNSSHIACSICGRVKAHRGDRPPYCPDCRHHANVLAVGAWRQRAACADPKYDRDWWWPESARDDTAAIAIDICRSCPVVADCLAHAITRPEPDGIWGGKTATQRARYLTARARIA